MKLKLKIPIPENATVYAENGNNSEDLLLYEVEQLEVLEEVKVDTSKVHFTARDGQYVKKGDIIFTEGFLGHKAMISDFNGILEITADRCKILGQKRHFERKINFVGTVIRVVPNRFIELECDAHPIKPVFYTNLQNRLTELTYFESKHDVVNDAFRFAGGETTVFVNDNFYLDELAKLIALGARRIVVNSVAVQDLSALKREVDRLEGFAVLAGFGDMAAQRIMLESPSHDIFWSTHGILVSDPVSRYDHHVYEHPFWGIQGDYQKKNELVGNLNYNREVFEFYLKNIEQREKK